MRKKSGLPVRAWGRFEEERCRLAPLRLSTQYTMSFLGGDDLSCSLHPPAACAIRLADVFHPLSFGSH